MDPLAVTAHITITIQKEGVFIRKRIAALLSVILVLSCLCVTAYADPAISTAPYTLTGTPGTNMKSPTELKKYYSGRAQVWLNSVKNSNGVTQSDAYGWADIYWFKTATDYVRATSISGNDNKVNVGQYKVIPYANSYGQPGRNYKLAMRIPSGAPASTYTYKGKWSPDNELG